MISSQRSSDHFKFDNDSFGNEESERIKKHEQSSDRDSVIEVVRHSDIPKTNKIVPI